MASTIRDDLGLLGAVETSLDRCVRHERFVPGDDLSTVDRPRPP